MLAPASDPPQYGNRPSNSARDYRRAYKACNRCRQTKAKCEPSPNSLACIKCVREGRDCEFPAERSLKRKTEHDTVAQAAPKLSGRLGALSPSQDAAPGQPGGTHKTTRQDRNGKPELQDGHRVRTTYDSDVVQTVVSSSNDALGLLFKAAEQQESDSDEQADPSMAPAHASPTSAVVSDMHLSKIPPSSLSRPSRTEILLWSKLRFVKQGWFSAIEAVTYIDLFFRNLSSLSPVSSSFYAEKVNHEGLIVDEPLLCCTLLMISSRYHVLPGPGGASRAEFIHMRLWRHCQSLISRITYGQEKYPVTKLRSLGSIKALLLMTEWHPRALHLPPEHDGWDASLTPSMDDTSSLDLHDSSHSLGWREEVLEPAKRSDWMSWMLLGHATSLAHELGVFEELDSENDRQKLSADTRARTRRMLFLYVNQLSLRIGCTSVLPPSLSLALSSQASSQQDPAIQERDNLIGLFLEITKFRSTTTDMFFPSKSATRQIMNSGRYVSLLEHFQPLLAQWYERFNDTEFTALHPSSKQVLFIEYSYVRMYINSIAIQAVVERAKSKGTLTILSHDFLRKEEYKFLQEVNDASRSVLATAVELAEADLLRYCPVRIFISVISASIFLLKAISLGTRHSELEKSLETLEKCIHALRYSTHDDMHLSTKYGMLLDRHVRKFKRNFRLQGGTAVPPTRQPGTSNGDEVRTNTQMPYAGSELPKTFEETLQAPDDNSMVPSPVQYDLGAEMDAWFAQPFDTSFAPFGFDSNQAASGLEINSLDFFWNLPT